MAKVVKAMPNNTKSKYSALYDQVFDGQVWKLTRGEDFDVSVSNIYTALRTYAHRVGINATIRIVGHEYVYVQAEK